MNVNMTRMQGRSERVGMWKGRKAMAQHDVDKVEASADEVRTVRTGRKVRTGRTVGAISTRGKGGRDR